jgi:cobalt-zinc-cadmium efflux system membrane fusion protein
MEIANPTAQDFDVTVKTSGKIDVPPQNRAQVTTLLAVTLQAQDYWSVIKLLIRFTDIGKYGLSGHSRVFEVAEQINYLKSVQRQKTLFDER